MADINQPGFNMGHYSIQDAAVEGTNMSDIVNQKKDPIGVDEIKKAAETLRKYKSGKQALENRIVANEQWWKMRHWDLQNPEINKFDPKPASGYLFNCIMSKHADFMDSFPEPAVLPTRLMSMMVLSSTARMLKAQCTSVLAVQLIG